MKILSLRTLFSAFFVWLCCAVFTNSALAAQQQPEVKNAEPPKPAGVPLPRPSDPVPYPYSSLDLAWPYNNLSLAASRIPTIDMNGAYYLPYLPWIGQNLAVLAGYADFFYQQQKSVIDGKTPAFDADRTTAVNNKISETQEENRRQINKKVTTDIQTQLNFNANPKLATLTEIPGTDTAIFSCTPGTADCELPSDSQFNADTLLGTVAYTSDQAKDMDTLITFLANLTQPFPDPGLSKDPKQRQTDLQNGAVKKYILAVRTEAALQSMALSNLNFLAKEREIIPGLGKEIGMTTPTGESLKDASQLQVEKFLIDKRLNNKDWYTAINNAPAIAVQRETLYVMAETQRQLYELRMLNERMLAALTSIQMGMTQLSRSNLELQAKTVKETLQPSDANEKTG